MSKNQRRRTNLTDSENSDVWRWSHGAGKTAASIIPTTATEFGTIIVSEPPCEILAITAAPTQVTGG